MNFAYTILYVDDVSATIDFYQNAFGFQQKFVTPEADYGELLTGSTTLAFASNTLAKSNLNKGYLPANKTEKPFGIELAFTTENIAADFEKAIAGGATEYAPLTEKPWGQTVGYLLDINGFLIEVCTPMGA
ncbi:MAG: VOC family protein [Bacteroidota bacterium]